MIVNPAYGGAYTYGKTQASLGFATSTVRRKDREEWLTLKPGAHEGYVSWERAEAIRKMVSNNVPQSQHHGLLSGLLRCRRCGRKLTVRYTGKKHDIPRYSCWRGLLDNGEARCISVGDLRGDDAIEHALQRVQEIETKIAHHDDTANPNRTALSAEDLATLGANLERVWFAPETDARLKKRTVRTVIREVVADIDGDASEIVLLVHWAGGAHAEIRLPKRRRGQRSQAARGGFQNVALDS
ncbi:recombinase zinc beta ribbon domain-containing protein [Celeribacter sp. SCSIO 80788]|uniref:recombinase zinc beta ribbon domain-containing protein n=1 Tax=Celeribacter sp. SCSIO 80788 TaxID=3117013 RepID=UPI003DA216C2